MLTNSNLTDFCPHFKYVGQKSQKSLFVRSQFFNNVQNIYNSVLFQKVLGSLVSLENLSLLIYLRKSSGPTFLDDMEMIIFCM